MIFNSNEKQFLLLIEKLAILYNNVEFNLPTRGLRESWSWKGILVPNQHLLFSKLLYPNLIFFLFQVMITLIYLSVENHQEQIFLFCFSALAIL